MNNLEKLAARPYFGRGSPLLNIFRNAGRMIAPKKSAPHAFQDTQELLGASTIGIPLYQAFNKGNKDYVGDGFGAGVGFFGGILGLIQAQLLNAGLGVGNSANRALKSSLRNGKFRFLLPLLGGGTAGYYGKKLDDGFDDFWKGDLDPIFQKSSRHCNKSSTKEKNASSQMNNSYKLKVAGFVRRFGSPMLDKGLKVTGVKVTGNPAKPDFMPSMKSVPLKPSDTASLRDIAKPKDFNIDPRAMAFIKLRRGDIGLNEFLKLTKQASFLKSPAILKILQSLGLAGMGGGIGYGLKKGLDADDSLGAPYNYKGNPNK